MATDFDLTQQSYASEGKHSGMLKGLRSIMFPFVSWVFLIEKTKWPHKLQPLAQKQSDLRGGLLSCHSCFNFLDHFLPWRFQIFLLSFHSCFSGGFSICSEDFIFFFCNFCHVFLDHFLPWRFQIFLLSVHSIFPGSFSAVKISEVSYPFHSIFPGSFSAVQISDF